MALPENPKIGDIITELQDLTLINQKAEMAGVVGAPTTSTSNNQDFVSTIQDAKDVIANKTGQNNTLPLLEMVNGIVIGRKWASGNVTSATTGIDFTTYNGGTSQRSYISVSGLTFKPSVIIVFSNEIYGCMYAKDFLYNGNEMSVNFTNSGAVSIQAQTSPSYVNETGFCLAVSRASEPFTWIAFE